MITSWEESHGTPDEQPATLFIINGNGGRVEEIISGTVAECRGWIYSHNLRKEDCMICRNIPHNYPVIWDRVIGR